MSKARTSTNPFRAAGATAASELLGGCRSYTGTCSNMFRGIKAKSRIIYEASKYQYQLMCLHQDTHYFCFVETCLVGNVQAVWRTTDHLSIQEELQRNLLDVGQLRAVRCGCGISRFVPPHPGQRLLCLLQHVQQL